MSDEPVVLDSVVQEVQVFRKGAVVTRVATLPAGRDGALSFAGLPLCVEDDSVRVAVQSSGGEPAPRPRDVRAELVVPPLGALLEPPSAEEVRAVERRIAELREQAAVIDAELAQVDRLQLGLPSWSGKEPPRPASAATFTGIVEWTAGLRQARLDEREALAARLQEAQDELERLRRREAEARAVRDARADAVSKRVVLRLSEPARGPLVLRLEYRVPGAWWVPSYVLRLSRDGRTARLGVRAHVAQHTGEPWTRVRLYLSTADLLRETELPELRSLRIGRRQPAPLKRAWRDPPVASETLLEGLRRALEVRRRGQVEPEPLAPSEALAYFEAQARLDDPFADGAPPGDPFGASAGADPFAAEVGHGFDADESFELAADVGGFGAADDSGAYPTPATGAPAPAAAPPGFALGAAPSPPSASRAGAPFDDDVPRMRKRSAPGAGGGGLRPSKPRPAPLEPAGVAPDASFMSYGDLAMPRWDDASGAAGKLRPLSWDDRLGDLDPRQRLAVHHKLKAARSIAMAVERLPLPSMTARVEASAGSFDHRYDTEGLVDVPSDDALHNVPLLTAEAPVRTTLVVVPRESDQAVRVATLTNPLEAPLLAGPAEVYLEDEFLVTAPLRTVPAGGALTVGLGLEPGLKVARNTFFEEKTTGLLGGGLLLEHRVEVDLASRLAAPVEVEVREVVPVKADKDQAIEVQDESARPAWDKFALQEGGPPLEGGRRWRVSLAPGEEKKLAATFALKLDGKNEVVGGNRRS